MLFGFWEKNQENPKVKSSPKEKAQNTHTHTHSLSVFPPRPTNLVTSFSDVVVVVSKKPSTSFWTSTWKFYINNISSSLFGYGAWLHLEVLCVFVLCIISQFQQWRTQPSCVWCGAPSVKMFFQSLPITLFINVVVVTLFFEVPFLHLPLLLQFSIRSVLI